MRYFIDFLRGLGISARTITKVLVSIFFIFSFALNIILMTWSAGALAVSGAFSAVTGISSTITDLQGANKRLKGQNEQLKTVNSQMKASSKTLSAQNKQLVATNAELDLKNKEATLIARRISARTVKGAVRNAAVIPAEAIPNIGLAVILGVTAYELADACATMKDINSLNSLMSGAAEIDESTVCGLRPPSTEDIFKALEETPEQAWNTASSYEIEVPSWQRVRESGKSFWDQTINLTTGLFKADDY